MDYDLGHHADGRDLADHEGIAWFHDVDFDEAAAVMLNQELAAKAYVLVKGTHVETTDRTRN